jgi:hypothetical protein
MMMDNRRNHNEAVILPVTTIFFNKNKRVPFQTLTNQSPFKHRDFQRKNGATCELLLRKQK